MNIMWQAQDGYVGGSRPQDMTINVDDYIDLAPEEIEDQLYEELAEDFRNKVSPEFEQPIEEIVLAIQEAIAEADNG